jgi:GH25 family lysozyme M1 (1,4-beta-N-acetylmuramidase)
MLASRGFVALVAFASLGISSCASDSASTSDLGETTSADTKICPATAPAPLQGVDVSDGQGTIDWAKAKAAGVAFAIIKASQGTYDAQSLFAKNWAGAKAAGVVRGAYHFFDPTEDGAAQAKKFLDTVGPLDDEDIAPMLDVECPDGDATCLGFSGGSGDAPAADIQQRIGDWLSAVEAATGRKPGIYTFGAYFAENKIGTTGLDAYPLWIADLSTTGCLTAPTPWSRAALWQTGWSGSIDGIAGKVDQDRSVSVGGVGGVGALDELLGWPRAVGRSRTDVNGDGRADLCARGPKGVTCALAQAAGGFGAEIAGPAWTDAAGWRFGEYAGTVQFGDVDGDGKADACGRAALGFTCATFDETEGAFRAAFTSTAWSDASGCEAPSCYATLQLADVDGDGKDDVCGRMASGIACARSNGAGFDAAFAGPSWSDAAGWGAPSAYTTIRFVDMDGDGRADVCGRGSSGLSCALSHGMGFDAEIAGPAWSDAAGWSAAKYAATVRLADIDGDGKVDACGRSAKGITCARFNGAGFDAEIAGPAWSDAAGWGVPSSYATLLFADINGDGKEDVCGRTASGVTCALATANGFGPEFAGPAWSDAAGWGELRYARTLAAADVNGDGRSDLCARGANGVVCAPSGGTGGTAFGVPIAGPAWSDAAGWGTAPYWGSVRLVAAAPSAKGTGPEDGGPPLVGDSGTIALSVSADAHADAGCSCRAAGRLDRRADSRAGWMALALCAVITARARARRARSQAGAGGSSRRASPT